MNSNDKQLYISVASVLSCLSVVVLHINGSFWTFTGDTSWIKANIIECFFYPAAPIFFMITGATLMDYRERYDTRTYVIKRVKRTLIPFIVWSLIGLIYRIAVGSIDRSSLTTKNIISSIVNTKYVSVYWFFIPLFSMYIFIVLASLIPEEKRRGIFLLFSSISVLLSVINVVFRLIGIQYNGAFNSGLSSYSTLILLGYYISHYSINRRNRIIIYISGFIGFLVHVIGTQVLSLDKGEIVDVFKGYINFPCVFHTVAIFTFFKYIKYERISHKIIMIVKWLSSATLGVYLIHWYLIDIIASNLDWFDLTRLSYKFLGCIIVFFASVLLAKAIKKIPIIENIC